MSIKRSPHLVVVLTTALAAGCGGGGGGGGGGSDPAPSLGAGGSAGSGGGTGGADAPAGGDSPAGTPFDLAVGEGGGGVGTPGGGDLPNAEGSPGLPGGGRSPDGASSPENTFVPVGSGPPATPDDMGPTGPGVANGDDASMEGSTVVALPGSALEHLQGLGDAGEFLGIVRDLGIDAYLADPAQRMTLIVPSDTAFAALTRQQRRELFADEERMQQLFSQLVVNERRITPATLAGLNGRFYADNVEFTPGDDAETLRANDVLARVSSLSDAAAIYTSDAIPVHDAFFAPDTGTIASKLGRDASFSFFARLLDEAGLMDALGDADRVQSVFAVPNEYFASAGVDGIEFDVERHESAEAFAGNHVVLRTEAGTGGDAGSALTAESGLRLSLTRADGTTRVNGLRVREDDKKIATNGVIDVIDYPLLGNDASGTPIEPTNLLEALRTAADRQDEIAENGDRTYRYCCDRYGQSYGYDEWGYRVAESDFNAYRFFVELIEAAESEYLFEDTDNAWTLLLPRDGALPDSVGRGGYGYTDGDTDDYYYGYDDYYYGYRELNTDPSDGGVATSVSRYVDYLREGTDSFSVVPDLVPDVLAAQDLLFAHLIRRPVSESELADFEGDVLRAVDGSSLDIENGYRTSVDGVRFTGDSIVASNGYVRRVEDFLSLPQGYVDHYSAYDPYADSPIGAIRALSDAGGYDRYLRTLRDYDYTGYRLLEYNEWTIFVVPDEASGSADRFSVLQSTIHTGGALSPADLEALPSITMDDGAAIEIIDSDSLRVGGRRVELVHSGSGSTIYTIDGIPNSDPYAGSQIDAARALSQIGGHDRYLDVFDATIGLPSLQDPLNSWTVFAISDEALERFELEGGDSRSLMQPTIVATQALSPADLESSSQVTANDGSTYAVTGSDPLYVGGHRVELAHSGEGPIVYTIDGIPGR